MASRAAYMDAYFFWIQNFGVLVLDTSTPKILLWFSLVFQEAFFMHKSVLKNCIIWMIYFVSNQVRVACYRAHQGNTWETLTT